MSGNNHCAEYVNNNISKILGLYHFIENYYLTGDLERYPPISLIEEQGQKIFDDICRVRDVAFKNEDEKKFKFIKEDFCLLNDVKVLRKCSQALVKNAAVYELSKEVNMLVCDIYRIINACFVGYTMSK
jgi:hypothetical protein